MVHFYISQNIPRLENKVISRHYHSLPNFFLEKANTIQYKEKAQKYLLGKILLNLGLLNLGYDESQWAYLRYNAHKKPYFENNVSFNISHSGDYVICVLSDTCEVGVDLEEIKDIELSDFLSCFTSAEWAIIHEADNPIIAFYHFWTRKEAVIKGDGRGLFVPLCDIEVIHETAVLAGITWNIKEIGITKDYKSHLATSIPITDDLLSFKLI